MNRQQLVTGCELWERIQKLKKEREFFAKTETVSSLRMCYANSPVDVDVSVLNFQTVKKNVLASYDKEIKKLEREFDKL